MNLTVAGGHIAKRTSLFKKPNGNNIKTETLLRVVLMGAVF